MPGTHCPTCARYEKAVMGRKPDEELGADVIPCSAFAMSDAFRTYLVDAMRKEVMAQVSLSGLDRMAIVKAGGPPADDEE